MNTFSHIKKLITNTPLIDIRYKFRGKTNHLFAKCEWYSLTGSIKDKVAYQILFDAYKNGLLKPNQPIIEVSSGNMGISIAAIGNLLKHPVTILMPKNMSQERKKILRLYGATLIETEDFKSAFALCEEFENKGYFNTRQFESISNYTAHKNITAREILNKIKTKNVTHFISGIGTSGTLSGVGSVLKNKLGIKIVALEPENARIITSPPPYGNHQLQGLSDEILPKLFNPYLCDNVLQIKDEDAIALSQKLCKTLSLGVGISSGANILGCILTGNNCITILPDDNKKYLSTNLTTPLTTPLVDSIQFIDFKIL